MMKKLLFAVSAISVLGLTSCGGTSFELHISGSEYALNKKVYKYIASRNKTGKVDTNVTWSVDNTDLATIDDYGNLTVCDQGTGTVTVTVTSKETKTVTNKYTVTIVGEGIENSVFITALQKQESDFWATCEEEGRHGKFEISTTHNKETDFIRLEDQTIGKIESVRHYVDMNINKRKIDCVVSSRSYYRDYPTSSSIQESFTELEKYKKEGHTAELHCFQYTQKYQETDLDFVCYYLYYVVGTTSKLVYRSFCGGMIINYLEVNDDKADIYLHLTPVL